MPEMPQAEEHGSRSHHLLLDNRIALSVARRVAEEVHDVWSRWRKIWFKGCPGNGSNSSQAQLQTLREANRGRTVCLLPGGEVMRPVRGSGQAGAIRIRPARGNANHDTLEARSQFSAPARRQ
ncbi:MAG: hypothetical protein IPJ07_21380 [Acidobacteria bacterium]|nr:hypothetical protein [Acidobacteriota bacterium]